ncbi:hypothetical protein FH972_003123 [Carpinus fangiana]|uniref:Uncharacterized protein n=1 Tax=Carpinus fangiana TaxID=176857 RepID=A0A5N6QGY3_9ROSI|nr:hypothetical protein FH972_003123 [Carpinus fangiana]
MHRRHQHALTTVSICLSPSTHLISQTLSPSLSHSPRRTHRESETIAIQPILAVQPVTPCCGSGFWGKKPDLFSHGLFAANRALPSSLPASWFPFSASRSLIRPPLARTCCVLRRRRAHTALADSKPSPSKSGKKALRRELQATEKSPLELVEQCFRT